jgi:hypothetical protein
MKTVMQYSGGEDRKEPESSVYSKVLQVRQTVATAA